MKRVAVYCGTRNLYQNMLTAAKSLIVNSSVDKIYFVIEDDKFPYILPTNIKVISVKDQIYFPPSSPSYSNKWTYMVLIRAALSKILPQEDLILSLDVDTIIDQNIDELWEIPMDEYYIAGAREPAKTRSDFLYINFGVCLLNLKKLRDDKLDDKIITALNERHWEANEQDVFNKFCQGKIYEFSSCYNANAFCLPTKDKKIWHFAGEKHWQHFPIVGYYNRTPLTELKRKKKQ